MILIPLDEQSIGKVLAEDIYDSSGRRLLAAGTRINVKSIQILESRGISEIHVDVTPAQTIPAPEDPEEYMIEGGFSTWKGKNVPAVLLKLSKNQCQTHTQDVFLPLKAKERVTDLTLTMVSEDEVIKRGSLFTLPEVYYHISRAISSPLSSAQDIGDAISRDPAFTAKLLQMANSSLYGFTRKITSIYDAVAIIGTQQLAMLSVGIAFTRSFQSSVLEASSMQNFWKHCIAAAVTAKELADLAGYKDKEVYFIGGLLHDIGKLLIYSAIPDSAYILHALCRSSGREQQYIEREYLSYDHSSTGSQFASAHNLPDGLKDMILFHHDPDRAKDPQSARIIHYADIIVNSMKIGSSGQYYVPVCNSEAQMIRQERQEILDRLSSNINAFTREMMGILLIN